MAFEGTWAIGSYCVPQGPPLCREAKSRNARPSTVNLSSVVAPTPYVHFPGTAREALTFYGQVFGCSVRLHTFEEFGRTDGPADAVAHGYLVEGVVDLFGSDAFGDHVQVRCEGLMLSLLGTDAPSVMKGWFSKLSEGGRIVDDLQKRPWGDFDGQVVDRYGLHWLVGFESSASD